jgi:predicted nucleotide-binding protein (sugar kinase/HSP70/actin superfamily)
MRGIKQGLDAVKSKNPNLAEIAAKAVWRSSNPPNVADRIPRVALTQRTKRRVEQMTRRQHLRIGIPRVLSMYSETPLFRTYFESLGVSPRNLIFSDFTSEELYKSGAKRGSIDPCFPSKVAMSHLHNLLFVHHKKKPLDLIFFPMIDSLTSDLQNVQGHRACPTVTATPEAVKAAFIKEGDVFADMGLYFLDPLVNISEPRLFERQMFLQFRDILGLSEKENRRAVEAGYHALDQFQNVTLRGTARQVLRTLETENRLGIVVLGRPYHNDPGINHGILEAFQKLGYPILTQDALPIDTDLLERLFGPEVRAGLIVHPMDISDVWYNSYSENTSRKVWAAKYVARHPNLVALELSNFKCGHDAPVYTVIEAIVEQSGTPYFCFKDIDENKPAGSIKVRLETIAYFLRRYQEVLLRQPESCPRGEAPLKVFERQQCASQSLPRLSERTAGSLYAADVAEAHANRCDTCRQTAGIADGVRL